MGTRTDGFSQFDSSNQCIFLMVESYSRQLFFILFYKKRERLTNLCFSLFIYFAGNSTRTVTDACSLLLGFHTACVIYTYIQLTIHIALLITHHACVQTYQHATTKTCLISPGLFTEHGLRVCVTSHTIIARNEIKSGKNNLKIVKLITVPVRRHGIFYTSHGIN